MNEAVAAVLKEMRERKVNHGKSTSPTLHAWADRIQKALEEEREEQRLQWLADASFREYGAREEL